MSPTEAHFCLDCDYLGHLVVVGGVSQCPRCASRAVWPVAGWIRSPETVHFRLPYHNPAGTRVDPVAPCCVMVPVFLGGAR